MLIIEERTDSEDEASDVLSLPFELRQKSRLRATLASGEDVALFMPRGTVLRDGDRLRASDGRLIRVEASSEQLIEVRAASVRELARAAYHLGNRHVPLQVGDGWLRLADDYVLRDLLAQLGATLILLESPFQPEAGAYGGGHAHSGGGHAHSGSEPSSRDDDHARHDLEAHDERSHRGIIHEYGPAHERDHEH